MIKKENGALRVGILDIWLDIKTILLKLKKDKEWYFTFGNDNILKYLGNVQWNLIIKQPRNKMFI